MQTNRAITINQQYENRQSNKSQSKRAAQIFPDAITNQSEQINSLKSISTVLSQALSTKDQQVVKQLLVTASSEVIKNTIAELAPSRTSALLQAIQKILLEDAKNTKNIKIVSEWLGQLLKKNIGHIINNGQLQTLSGRISRIIKKRVAALSTLNNLNAQIRIRNESAHRGEIKYTPKFHYIEEENEMVHREDDQDSISQKFNKKKQEMSDISDMAPEDFDNIDAMLMNDDVDLEM